MLALAAVVAAAGVLAWRAWSGGEEAAVRARLASLAEQINAPAGEGLGAVAQAAAIGDYFTEDVVIDLGPGTSPIESRPMVIGMAARLRPRIGAFRLVLDDIVVEMAEGEAAAAVRLTVSFIRRSAATGQEPLDAREFALSMRRDDGEWRIARLALVATLR